MDWEGRRGKKGEDAIPKEKSHSKYSKRPLSSQNNNEQTATMKKNKCPLRCSSLVLQRHIKISVPGLQPHLNSNLLDISRYILSFLVHMLLFTWPIYPEYSFPYPHAVHLTDSYSSFKIALLGASSPLWTPKSILKCICNGCYPTGLNLNANESVSSTELCTP